MHLWQWSVTNCRINQIEQAIQTCDNFLVNKKLFIFIKYDFQFSQLEKGGKKIEKWSSLILFPRGKHCEQFIPDFFVSFTKNLDPVNLDPFRSLTSRRYPSTTSLTSPPTTPTPTQTNSFAASTTGDESTCLVLRLYAWNEAVSERSGYGRSGASQRQVWLLGKPRPNSNF